MPQYGLFEEGSGKIQYYEKNEARQELNTRLGNAQTDEEKRWLRRDLCTVLQA